MFEVVPMMAGWGGKAICLTVAMVWAASSASELAPCHRVIAFVRVPPCARLRAPGVMTHNQGYE